MNRFVQRALIAGSVGMLVLGTAVAPAAASSRKTLAGSVPGWANTANFRRAADPDTVVGFRVYLGLRHRADAVNLAKAVSSPGSAAYGEYISAASFRRQFAPTKTQVSDVRSWLRNQGFTIDYTPDNRRYVAAEGTLRQAAKAFGTTFNEYRVNGKTVRSPAKSLSVPSSLGGTVMAVLGLDESATFIHTDSVRKAPPPAGFRNAPPCSEYYGEKTTATNPSPQGVTLPDVFGSDQPYAPCGYTPSQLRGAYGVSGSGLDGSGVTVAVIDAYASATILQDVNRYSADHGLPALNSAGAGHFSQVVAPGTFQRAENPVHDPQGWSGEETLDVEAVHSMAPGADIVYVGAPNNYQDLDAALNHVVDRHLADIVTNSYGFSTELLPTGYVKPYTDMFIQAAAEGIGVYFSSGDAGDETGGDADNAASATPDWPASSPWVTAVGGTSLAVGATNDYQWETGWQSGNAQWVDGDWSDATGDPPGLYQYGAGGGTSRLFAEPWYQAGVVPESLAAAHGGHGRVVPDVSAVGDPNTGMLVGQTQTFPDGTYYDTYRLGGTSLSSPLLAGLVALADQKAGHPHGFINPALYANAGTGAFRDVTAIDDTGVWRVDYVNAADGSDGYTYKFRTFNVGDGTGDISLTIHTAPGYDNVTGIGSPNGSAFFDLAANP
ncbi:MAG TPA: S53 family peptidase [Candidatus Limnocylindrales bacterium]